jgi:hypothetical protein
MVCSGGFWQVLVGSGWFWSVFVISSAPFQNKNSSSQKTVSSSIASKTLQESPNPKEPLTEIVEDGFWISI